MNRGEIQKYLRMLGQELQKRQVMGEILVADEVMVLLDIGKPEVSKNIDAYYGGHGTAIREAVASIAEQEGLPGDWLHDALKEFFYSYPSHEKWVEYPGLRIYLAPSDYVLAMKVAAASGRQDIEDIKILAGKLHISNAQDMVTLIVKYIPEQLLVPAMRLTIKQSFESRGAGSRASG